MNHPSTTLSPHHREKLAFMRGLLGLQQNDLADDIGVSSASISKFFAPGSKHQGLSADNEAKLMAAINAQIARIEAYKSRAADALADLNEVRQARTARAANDIEPSKIISFKQTLAGIALGEGANDAAKPPKMIVAPRGSLAVFAINYLERAADKEIRSVLEEGTAPASIVVAPINGGTSSFLNRVYDYARNMENCRVAMANLDVAFAAGEKITQVEIFGAVFRAIGMPLGLLLGDAHEMKEAFRKWAETAWTGFARVVVVIDGLDQLFKLAGSITDPLALVNWLSELRYDAARGTPPFNRLVLVTAFSGKSWSAAHASPYATQASELRLEKLTETDVVELFRLLDVSTDKYDPKHVYELFHGHPYLTHLYAWDIRSGKDFEQATERALEIESDYEAHWERMKLEIGFLVGRNYALKDLFKAVLLQTDNLNDESSNQKQMEDIWREYGRSLREFGLIDGNLREPTVCRFYLHAIRVETKQV